MSDRADDDAAQTEAARALRLARAAFDRRDWDAARRHFAEAADSGPLSSDDVYALAEADWWLGLVNDALSGYESAYQAYLTEDRPDRAAVSALDAATSLFLRGDMAVGSGWFSRFQRLVADRPDTVEHGRALSVEFDLALPVEALDQLLARARQLQELGRRHGDQAVLAVGTMAEGRALVRHGRVVAGLALMDEALLPALAGELPPALVGYLYCTMISTCRALADLARMAEWTEVLARWCDRLPPAVLFTGICRVHRAQLMHAHGEWERAEAEADRVCRDLLGIQVESVAEGRYVIGDTRRLRGDLRGAAAAYGEALELGRDPQPGRALLLLAQGRVDAAAASVQAAVATRPDRLTRTELLGAQVEVALAGGDLETARAASAELDAVAAEYASAGLRAAALLGRGWVQLADGSVAEAARTLRSAAQAWRALSVPYEVARARLGLARALADLGDREGADLELDAAVAGFRRLGAGPDLRAAALLRMGRRAGRSGLPDGLSAREAEVLALVADGLTNREVAASLVISEKTVARHLSNIFVKCGLTSRSAAAAYSVRHGLSAPER